MSTICGRLTADSVIEIEVGAEVPRDAKLHDYCEEDEYDQRDEQSDTADPAADRGTREGQKENTETRLYPREDR